MLGGISFPSYSLHHSSPPPSTPAFLFRVNISINIHLFLHYSFTSLLEGEKGFIVFPGN